MFFNLEKILWGISFVFLSLTSFYLLFYLKGRPFNLRKIIKYLKRDKKNKQQISAIESLMMVLGGRTGVGSIAGIGLAIYYGGIGSIFWLIVSSIILGNLIFTEAILAKRYTFKIGNENIGGVPFYIKKGLNKPKMANIYSVILLIAYIFGFLSIQSNTITTSIIQIYPISPILIGIIISIITFFIIKDGIKNIIKISSKIVPIMGLIYLSLIVSVIIINIKIIPQILLSIVKEAFNFKSLGFGIISSIIIGFQRGIFSTEAGLGTTSIAVGCSDEKGLEKDAYIQIVGIFITTFIICLGTAIVLLTYPDFLSVNTINGIELIQASLKYNLGNIGPILLIISIILFAFSTIISGYYYGEVCLLYLSNSLKSKRILKIFTILIVFLGCLFSATFLWKFTDTLIAILIIINTYTLFKLRNKI